MTAVEDESLVLDLLRSASGLSSTSLDLSKKNISLLPEADFPSCPRLECLYLEGNNLTAVPSSLFIQCPALKWLDLRNNSIQSLSPSIENLKHLRTLLLEGNKLIQLPSQLGILKRLNGLSLTGNPLQYPPKEIVQQGTKVVLQYLREKQKDLQEQSEESSDEDKIHLEPLSTKRSLISEIGSSPKSIHLKKATLQTRRTKSNNLKPAAPDVNQKQSVRKITTKTTSTGMEKKTMKDQIDKELAREQSKQTLNDWRKETRKLQKEAQTKEHPPDSTTKTAPFATKDNTEKNKQEAEKTHKKNSETIITEWTKDYARKLQETREKGGILEHPASSNLLEAERKLAEALAARKHFETKRVRNYRLTAFTGDIYND